MPVRAILACDQRGEQARPRRGGIREIPSGGKVAAQFLVPTLSGILPLVAVAVHVGPRWVQGFTGCDGARWGEVRIEVLHLRIVVLHLRIVVGPEAVHIEPRVVGTALAVLSLEESRGARGV